MQIQDSLKAASKNFRSHSGLLFKRMGVGRQVNKPNLKLLLFKEAETLCQIQGQMAHVRGLVERDVERGNLKIAGSVLRPN
jgi:hypothetical protein